MPGRRIHLVDHWLAERTACGLTTQAGGNARSAGLVTIELKTVSCKTCQGTHLYFDLRKNEGTVKRIDGSHQKLMEMLADA